MFGDLVEEVRCLFEGGPSRRRKPARQAADGRSSAERAATPVGMMPKRSRGPYDRLAARAEVRLMKKKGAGKYKASYHREWAEYQEGGGRKRSQQAKTYAKMAPYDTGKKAQRDTVKATGNPSYIDRRSREASLGKKLAAKGKPERGYSDKPLSKGTFARGDLKRKSIEGHWPSEKPRDKEGKRQRSVYVKGRRLPLPR